MIDKFAETAYTDHTYPNHTECHAAPGIERTRAHMLIVFSTPTGGNYVCARSERLRSIILISFPHTQLCLCNFPSPQRSGWGRGGPNLTCRNGGREWSEHTHRKLVWAGEFGMEPTYGDRGDVIAHPVTTTDSLPVNVNYTWDHGTFGP